MCFNLRKDDSSLVKICKDLCLKFINCEKIIFKIIRCRSKTALDFNSCSDSEEMFIRTKYMNNATIKFYPVKTITSGILVIL